MRFPIDVVFLNENGWPIEIRTAVPPNRIATNKRAAAVIELKAGEADRHFVVVE